jgi:undecaprenyl pyrophosphate phosphatase UppP
LQTRKQQYIQWQTFWIWIILQYVLFIGILFLLYRWINISLYNATIFIAVMLWVLRVIIFYKDKWTFLRIPVISEITSLVFH